MQPGPGSGASARSDRRRGWDRDRAPRSPRSRLDRLGLGQVLGELRLFDLRFPLAQPPVPPDPGPVEHRSLQTRAHVPPSAAVLGDHRHRAGPAHPQPASHHLLHGHLARDPPAQAVLGHRPKHRVGSARVHDLGAGTGHGRGHQVGHPAPLPHRAVLGGEDDGVRQPLSLDGLEHPFVVPGPQDHVDALVPRPELLGQEVERSRPIPTSHQQAGGEFGRVAERTPQWPDHVQDVVRLDARQPGRPRPPRLQNDLEGPGPASSARGLVDGERPPEQEVPAAGHRDLHELAGLGLVRHVGGDQRDRVVGAGAPVRQHLAPRSDHRSSFDSAPTREGSPTPTSESCSGPPGGGTAAWYSWMERGTAGGVRRASIPCTAARIPGTVVMQGTPTAAAAVRMKYPSVRGPRPKGVLITRSTFPARIRSAAFGLPSERFRTGVARTPALASMAAVPPVARTPNPSSASRRTAKRTARLSRFATETKTVPPPGRAAPVACWALARASPRLGAIPITSPVERISGPSTVSTPGNLPNGRTAALTATWGIRRCAPPNASMSSARRSARRAPAMTLAASFASGSPVALPTNGTVREARGLASSTYGTSSRTAIWTFSSPRIPKALAIEETVSSIARALGIRGLLNVQIAVRDDVPYVLEANPRASRTVPFVGKATGLPLAKLAARVMAGARLADLRAEGMLAFGGAHRRMPHVAVKAAVLPFGRFPGVDTVLGPEMRSTGEVMGIAPSLGLALAKAQQATGADLPGGGTVFVSVANRDKRAVLFPVLRLAELGFGVLATGGTAAMLARAGVPATPVRKRSEGSPNAADLILAGKVDLVINTPFGRGPRTDGYFIRTAAAAVGVPCITTVPGIQIGRAHV